MLLSIMVVGGGLELSKGVSHLRLDRVLTMGEQERDDERLQVMFYSGPTMGAKCTYQNPELGHVRVDVTTWPRCAPRLCTSNNE